MIQFSICLPVRNGWPYIKDCVESILQQKYPHIDLHVLDNNSTDNTLSWLTSLNDHRIRIWRSSTSLSIVDSWNRIQNIEKQQYMTLIGHDDILDSGFFSTIKELILQYPDAGLYSTGGRLINPDGNIIRSCKSVARIETAEEYLKKRFKFERDVFGTGYVMRSAEYDRLGGIPHFERLFFADDALWLSLMQGRYKATDPEEYFSVRLHSGSESASLPSAWPSILLGLCQFNQFLQNYNKNNKMSRSVTEAYSQDFMLTYHRNAYILALVEASQVGEKISPKTIAHIQSSLEICAPNVKHSLSGSAKTALISALNHSPFRALIPWMWRNYFQIKTKSRPLLSFNNEKTKRENLLGNH